MGQLLCAEGEWNEAARHFRLALQQADTAETRNNLGMALVSAGDRQGAIAQFQNALKISPDNQAARANLLKMGAADGANSNGD
jgi:Tfp pilus assembly protein PilF